MKAKDIIYKAMNTRNYTQSTLADVAGFKRVSNVSEILRSQNMRIDNFVKLLNAMGYDVIVEDNQEKLEVTLDDESSKDKEMNISDAIRKVMRKKNVTLQSMATSLGKSRSNDISSRLANKNLTTSSALEMLEVLDYELVIQEKRQDIRPENQIVITFEEDNKRTKRTPKEVL